MKFSLLVYRQEKITPTNFVLVKAETIESPSLPAGDKITSEEQLLGAIRDAVKKWVLATHEGRGTYKYAEDDMNLGDLSDHADDIVHYAKGIASLSFEEVTSAEHWTYDTSLCDYVEDMPEALTAGN